MRIRRQKITPLPIALILTALLSLMVISIAPPTLARAQSANPNPPTPPAAPTTEYSKKLADLVRQAVAVDPMRVLRKAQEVEAAGDFSLARTWYYLAFKSFDAHGKPAEAQNAMRKSEEMIGKAETAKKGGTATPAQPEAALVGPGSAAVPLSQSAVVRPNKHGVPAVTAKGIKLSRHDKDISNPRIVVAPNGTIHVAFIEQMQAYPFTYSVYHRSSSDGGRSWSAAKNVSEVLPDYGPGYCQIAADGAGRVYVIWRIWPQPNVAAEGDSHTLGGNNLVYRVLEGGAWSGKAIFVHPPATRDNSESASASWFAATDPTGKVHVIWNTNPDKLHPEGLSGGRPSPGIALGDVLGVTLDGQTPSAPQEIYQTKILKEADSWPHCDSLDMLNGYVDARGQAHILALVNSLRIGQEPTNRFQIIENGTQTTAVELPGLAQDYWHSPPQLLVDAQGKRHVVTMYPRGEQPNVRDYVVGSEAEPTVIRSAKEVSGKLQGFQAYQGPGGQMIALMQMNDTGENTDSELYVSTSNGGGKWSTPVNVTNNTGHETLNSRATSSQSSVTTVSYFLPDVGAATFDKSGHLVMAYICKEHKIFGTTAFGIGVAGNDSLVPELLFLRF